MEIEKQLSTLWDRGELPSAILFVGPSDRTAELITVLIKKILGTELLETHTDFLRVDSHKVGGVRDLLSFLSFKSFGKRVVLLENTEDLTPSSVNSLLKKIEEPPENTYFIAASSHEEKLLPTLRSRLTTFRLQVSSRAENAAADNFTKAEDLAARIKIVKDFDIESEDLNSFLRSLYQREIKNFGQRSSDRLISLLRVFEFLSSNVAPQRALFYLAIHW